MDAVRVSEAELTRALDDLEAVNRWLGGFRALRLHLDDLRDRSRLRVLDVGAGDGAALRHLRRWAPACWRFVGLEVRPQLVRIARRRCRELRRIRIVGGDALGLPFRDGAFDVAICTLTLHHFEEVRALAVVREMSRVSRRRVVVNDLERSLPNYAGAVLLAHTAWRHSRLTRHDGPLSVLRSFSRGELRAIGRLAGLRRVRVRRRFPFRLVLEGRPPRASAGDRRGDEGGAGEMERGAEGAGGRADEPAGPGGREGEGGREGSRDRVRRSG